MSILLTLVLAILILFILVLFSSIKIVPQSNKYIVERLGKYYATLEPGMHVILPFFDRVAEKIDIREQVLNFPPQAVITTDNVKVSIDLVVYVAVTDPYKFCYNVGSPVEALENLASTTLRNIMGSLELDETLTSRDKFNIEARQILDEATNAWGMKVARVEIKNILPPQDIQEAMEKQMRAERERRARVLDAEGFKAAAITEAEGIKESTVLKAEAEKKQAILKAEGEAEAILKVQKAYAESLKLLNEANPNEAILKLKGYEAFEKMAEGSSSKLIIPSDVGNIATIGSLFQEGTKISKEK